uniref:Uncharacterized protein n=1 Tax=Theropithecus gelada TaxID=9565 RepID=A0A8D2G2B1_THEGE
MIGSDSELPGTSGTHPLFSMQTKHKGNDPQGSQLQGGPGRLGVGVNAKSRSSSALFSATGLSPSSPPCEQPRDKKAKWDQESSTRRGCPPTRFLTDLSKVLAVPPLWEAYNACREFRCRSA